MNQANGQCGCPSTFVQSGSTCVCPPGQILNPAGNQCVSCSIPYCETCSTDTVCQTCSAPLISNGIGGCQCPSTFSLVNGVCVCPSGFSLSGGSCFDCQNVAYCTVCSADSFCSQCYNNLVAVNGACQCADSSFTLDTANSQCICPANTTMFNSHCFACSLSSCTLCQTDNACATCSSPFVPSNGVCVCPPTFV